jgi:hypothetical protein
MITNHLFFLKKDKKRITYFFLTITILLLIILNTQIIHAENVPLPPFPTTTQVTQTTDVTNIIIQENIKTRMEIKQYCDQKIQTMIDTVRTDGQNFIGQNFAEFDRRIHELAQKLFIKVILGAFTTILLAQLIFYIIKRKIDKKHMPRATIIKEISLSPTQAGIIIKENIPIPIPIPIPPNQPKEKELPTFPELQQPILLSPKEREKILREQEEIDKRKKEEAQRKLEKLIKEQNKKRKKLKKINKKLDKPEQTKKQLDDEHATLQKQINEISNQYNIPVKT